MASTSYFIPIEDLPNDYDWKDKLGSPIEFTLDSGSHGILLTSPQVAQIKDDCNLEQIERFDSNFQNIVCLRMRDKGAPEPASVVFDGLPRRTGKRGRVTSSKWDGQAREKFKKLTEKILAPALPDQNIHMSVPHGKSFDNLAGYTKADSFNVYFWSGAAKTKIDQSPPRFWDIKVECTDAPFLASGDGIHAIMAGDYCVAEMFEDSIFIHHDLPHHGYDSELMIYRKILEEAAAIFQNPDLIIAAREDRLRRNVNHYVTLCQKGTAEKVEQLERDLRTVNQEVDSSKEHYTSILRKRDNIMVEIPRAREMSAEQREHFAKDYERLCEFADVNDIQVFGDRVEIKTDHLYCTNPDTEIKHWMGRFKITIDARGRGGGVRWNNLDFTVVGYENNCQAPHVFNEGKACLGSLDSVIPEYLAKWDFATLTTLAIGFIQSVNPSDPAGKYIVRWPIADDYRQKAIERGYDPDQYKQYRKRPNQ